MTSKLDEFEATLAYWDNLGLTQQYLMGTDATDTAMKFPEALRTLLPIARAAVEVDEWTLWYLQGLLNWRADLKDNAEKFKKLTEAVKALRALDSDSAETESGGG